MALDRDGLVDHLWQVAGTITAAVARRPIVEQHDELVTAHAGQLGSRRAGLGQPRGQRDEQLVTDAVPERVVDDLEPVEVEQDSTARPRWPCGRRDPAGPARAVDSRKAHRLGRSVSGSWRDW